MTNGTADDHVRRSWVTAANDPTSDFPIQNLPYGIFRRRGTTNAARVGVAIGDQIVDMTAAVERGLLGALSDAAAAAVRSHVLNAVMALDRGDLLALRHGLIALLDANSRHAGAAILVPMRDAELLLPADIGDYTDFFASIHHATRTGALFRPDRPLTPNYKYVPVAYHGRASSVVVSGTVIVRPHGQSNSGGGIPTFGPTTKLDYEAEIGLFVASSNRLGERVSIDDAERQLFGVCLLNDWSARDLQAWEAQPLGPFLSKSFASTISPWVVTMDALAPFRCPPPPRPAGDPEPLPYLQPSDAAATAIDITIEVFLRSERMRRQEQERFCVSRSSFRHMYWTPAQMVAHHTSNGCNLQPGDLLGSGTVSGPERGSEACLLEMTRNGRDPIALPSGETRAFLADGDEVTIRAYCEREGAVRIGFGECTGVVVAGNL